MFVSKDAIPQLKGTFGDSVTFYERNGKIIMRAKHPRKGLGKRTPARLEQQSRISNVTSCWSAFGGTLKGNFELKKPGQTDYNAFQANNLPNARVFLTHEEAVAGASVADNFVISRGTLEPSVQVATQGDWMVSDIAIGDLELTADTPLYRLAGAIQSHNRGFFRAEDEIVFYRTLQGSMPRGNDEQIPCIAVSALVVPLSAPIPFTLRTLVPGMREGQQYADGFRNVDGFLVCERVKDSLVAWVHRRRVDEKHYVVCSQSLYGTNEMLVDYANEEAVDRAVKSYKPNADSPMGSRKRKVVNPFVSDTKMVTIEAVALPNSDKDKVLHGRVTGGGVYPLGFEVTLRAIPDEGYRFLWWDDFDRSRERRVVVREDCKYGAFFTSIRDF